MAQDRQLYRSRDALVGGVCAGLADYFGVDPVVVRILALVLTIVTGGVAGVCYLILWAVVEREPERYRPLDVEPDEVESETYGTVDCETARGGAFHRRLRHPASTTAPFQSSGRKPPEPPALAHRAEEQQPDLPSGPLPDGRPTPGSRVALGLVIGSLIVFVLFSVAASSAIDGTSWWMFWPLLLVIAGIVRMVVPARRGRRMDGFVLGAALFAFGVVLLPMSTHLMSWDTIRLMFVRLWPLLLAAVLLFAAGKLAQAPMAKLAGALLIVAFCLLGVALFAQPGTAADLAVDLPEDRELRVYEF